MTVVKVANVESIDRGSGIITIPLITKDVDSGARITTGMSVYPVDEGAPLHTHNCDEQVTLLEGEGEVEIEGVVTSLTQYDSTYIVAGQQHAFRNIGTGVMRILWIYPSTEVTRTVLDSGLTVVHLSKEDLMGLRHDGVGGRDQTPNWPT